MVTPYIALLIVLFISPSTERGSTAVVATDISPLEARFRSEYPAGVLKLSAPLKNIECKGQRLGSFSSYRANVRLAALDDSRLEHRVYDPTFRNTDTDSDLVRCMTPGWMFQLRRTSATTPFLVAMYGNDPKSRSQFQLHIDVHINVFLRAALWAYDTSVSDMLADPNAVITKISETVEGGETQILVEFDLKKSKLWLQSAQLTLLPDKHWAVKKYRIVTKGDNAVSGEYRGQIEYGDWPGGVIFPKHIHMETEMPIGKKENMQVEDLIVEDVVLDRLTDDQFRLSASACPKSPSRRSAPRLSSPSPIRFFG